MVAAIHPEVEAETLRSAVQGAWRGHDGTRAFMRDTAESFEVFEPSYSEVRELPGNRVLAVGSILSSPPGRASSSTSPRRPWSSFATA